MDRIEEKSLQVRFSEAVEGKLIQAYFQPIFRSMTGKIIGVEALARWFMPDGSMLSPADFIPEMERTGLIFDLDLEILRQACVLYDELRRRGTPLQCVSVNLSRKDFRRDDLYERICSVLNDYSVPHRAVKLEITEGLMLQDTEHFEKTISQFRDAGFSIWLDDFGSGYSSLNVLQNYSFDVIKFDMHFLKNFSVKGKELLASLISMAKTLEIHTLTEGIETKEQREFLLAAGCEAQQGFYYSKPLPKKDLIALIDQKPGIPEDQEDYTYWNTIGRLNFVNPNPLKEYSERQKSNLKENFGVGSFDGSIALVECGKDHFDYIYATEGYKERLSELSFSSVDGLENALSNQRSYQFLMIRKLVLDAINSGTVQTIEYAYKDVYYRLSALAVARRNGRAMIVMRLNTFDSEHEIKTAQEMLNHGSALLTTYELVVFLYPESRTAKRIYAANSLPVFDRDVSIEEGVRKFSEAEVAPEDRERYLRFMDFGTMAERIGNSSSDFIQGVFRMTLNKAPAWYIARVTQIPTLSETQFILTIQSVQDDLLQWLDLFADEHPELF